MGMVVGSSAPGRDVGPLGTEIVGFGEGSSARAPVVLKAVSSRAEADVHTTVRSAWARGRLVWSLT